MQLLDTPRKGKLGANVFYTDASGERQFCRIRAIPKDPQTPAQMKIRALMGYASAFWDRRLDEPQREQWIAAALNAPTHGWMGRYAHLSGQQFEVKINVTLACIGKPMVLTPPEPVVFSANPVTAFEAVQDPQAGLRLLLNVGTVSEEIMVFGQPPCSSGRMKPRRVYYLGLLGPAANGQIDFTELYTARFGAPRPGQKIFIVTCQTKNGWKAQDYVFRAIVPPPPDPTPQQVPPEPIVTTASPAAPPPSSPAPAQPSSSSPPAVYMGSTPGARGGHSGESVVPPRSLPGASHVHSVWTALRRLGVLGMNLVGEVRPRAAV